MADELKLLRVLIAVADTGSVSAAAHHLGITQPGISNALQRLRAQHNDVLFVRTSDGMEPTATARRLIETGRSILKLYQEGIENQCTFDPNAPTEFRFAMADVGEASFLPRLLGHLRVHAPNASVRSVSLSAAELASAIRADEVDLALGYFPDLKGPHFYQQKLFSEGFVCLLRAGHPCARGLTVETFLELEHAVVQVEGRSQEVFEKFLRQQKMVRKVRLQVPHYLSLSHVITKSDLVVTVPFVLAVAYAERGDLTFVPLPFPAPRFDVKQHWHRRANKDPRNRWLRQQVLTLYGNEAEEKVRIAVLGRSRPQPSP